MDQRVAAEFRDVRSRLAEQWDETQAEIATEHQSCASRQCRLAGAATAATIVVGGSEDVTVTWSTAFPTETYAVDLVPTGLVGKATLAVIDQDPATATVRVTATALVAAGSQFLAHGHA